MLQNTAFIEMQFYTKLLEKRILKKKKNNPAEKHVEEWLPVQILLLGGSVF